MGKLLGIHNPSHQTPRFGFWDTLIVLLLSFAQVDFFLSVQATEGLCAPCQSHHTHREKWKSRPENVPLENILPYKDSSSSQSRKQQIVLSRMAKCQEINSYWHISK